jgi:hypothetical protein
VWTAVAALTVWPHGVSYTNELWDGAYLPETRRQHFDFLCTRQPAGRTTTFLIYGFTQEAEPKPAGVMGQGR